MAYGASEKLILSEKTRWSYVNVVEPKAVGMSEPKYSVTLIIKKGSPDMEVIANTIKEVYKNNTALLTGVDGVVPPLSTLKNPVRDGDTERADDPAFAGSYFITASSKYQPAVYDSEFQPMTDLSQIYSGCYGAAGISFYAYNTGENCGIGCSLNNLMKCKDGERLGGAAAGSSGADDFRAFFAARNSAEKTTESDNDSLPF